MSTFAKMALVGASLMASVSLAESKTSKASATTPFRQWSASQQWLTSGDARDDYGYFPTHGALLLADELGEKLSEQGRAGMIISCFTRATPDAKSAMAWMLCGTDVNALDLTKMAAELDADGADATTKAARLKEAGEAQEEAKKIGAAVEAAAARDPGLKQLLKIADTAKTEWKAYLAKHKSEFDLYLALKDGVRTGKANDPAFDGCYEKTLPAFTRIVKQEAPKIPFDVGRSALAAYVNYMTDSLEGYIATTAWAACAWSSDPSGESPYAAAANQPPIVLRAGWRTLALSHALEPDLKLNFADRSLSWRDLKFRWGLHQVHMKGINDTAGLANAHMGKIGVVTVKGDTTHIKFKDGQEMSCLEWRDTNRIQSTLGGNIVYEKTCAKRGMRSFVGGDDDAPTKYLAKTAKVGESIAISNHFPTATWKGEKVTSILGVALP